MEEKELLDLIALFEKSSLHVLEIEKNQETFKVRLEKGAPFQILQTGYGAVAAADSGSIGEEARVNDNQVTRPDTGSDTGAEQAKAAADCNAQEVKAPIVGIFYEAPSPGEEPYVKLGQEVKAGQTLCLIEAMKMMNELKSPVDGVIKRIYAENSALVEFGQILYEVESC